MTRHDPPLFELRSGRLDAVLFVLKTTDLPALRQQLTRRLAATPEFFGGDAIALDLRRLAIDAPIDLAALERLLSEFRMRPLGVVLRPDQSRLSHAATLPRLDCGVRPAHADGNGDHGDSAGDVPQAAEPAAPPTATPDSAPLAPTLLIDKPLRSGQRIVAPGDLIVTAAVSHGAELIAAGHIHVYATLRGRALAGALGRTDARIFCSAMDAELLAIAGLYRTAEQPYDAAIQGQPACARLVADRLVITALAPS